MKTSAICHLPFAIAAALLLCSCDTTNPTLQKAQASIDKFNASPTGQRLGQDAQVAADAAAAAAAQETVSQLQTGGKVDGQSIGTAAGAAAVGALIQLDVQRAAAKPKASAGKTIVPPSTSLIRPHPPVAFRAPPPTLRSDDIPHFAPLTPWIPRLRVFPPRQEIAPSEDDDIGPPPWLRPAAPLLVIRH